MTTIPRFALLLGLALVSSLGGAILQFFETPEGSPNLAVFGVSDDGLIVVGQAVNANGDWRAFRWREGEGSTIIPLPSDPAPANTFASSWAYGVSD